MFGKGAQFFKFKLGLRVVVGLKDMDRSSSFWVVAKEGVHIVFS